MSSEVYLRRAQAAEYQRQKYGFGSPKTLGKLATIGGGPVFRHFGRFPLYAPGDLDKWMLSRLSGPKRSTSDRGRANGSKT